jgi:hypothetical protein
MRKNNYIKSIVLASALLFFIAGVANAQDSTFKPSGKLWGQVFADALYKGHTDSLKRGFGQYAGTTNYPQSFNAFQFRRVYLGYNYDIAPKFSAEVLLSAENNNSTTQDVLGDGKLAPFIKYANIRMKNVFPGADLVFGQQATPAFAKSSEPIWGYRSIEKTITDFHGTPSYDMGVSLQGKFDPKTGCFGYNVLIANGTSAKVAPTTSYKWLYADIWGTFLNKKLFVDLYADYNLLNRVQSTATKPVFNTARNMVKLTVGYTTPKFAVGAEAFINTFTNQFTATAAAVKDTLSPAAEGISLFVRGAIIPGKLGFFARYDMVNPNTKVDSTKYGNAAASPYGALVSVSSYTSTWYSKETFITAGLDFTPSKDIHIMPNIWYNGYAAQYAPTTGANAVGTKAKDYDLVYRVTFAYTFGK